MTKPTRADRTLVTGQHGTVEYAIRLDDTMEVRDFFDSQSISIRAGFGVLFTRLTNDRRIQDVRQFHPVDEMWVFKKGDFRILTMQLGTRWLLLHWYKKNRDKIELGAKTHARTVYSEHMQWEAKHQPNVTRKP